MTFGDDSLEIPEEHPQATEESAEENVSDEFVDVFNARDIEGIAELLADDIDAEFLHVAGSRTVLEGFEGFFIRQPHVLATRGEQGTEPIVALWRPDGGDEDADSTPFMAVGFLILEFTEHDEPLISRIEYAEELDEVLVEEPDDIIEGLDWELADQG
jgi:hypothetical protein